MTNLQVFTEVARMRVTAADVVKLSWLAFVVYWLISALRVKKMKTREPIAQRLVYLFAIAFVAVLLYTLAPLTVLHRRFVPRLAWIEVLGAGLTVAGVGFAIWARAHIGQYWSASVALREGHQLIRTGPYARIRHPIYSGALLALAGTCPLYRNFQRQFFLASFWRGSRSRPRKKKPSGRRIRTWFPGAPKPHRFFPAASSVTNNLAPRLTPVRRPFRQALVQAEAASPSSSPAWCGLCAAITFSAISAARNRSARIPSNSFRGPASSKSIRSRS